MVAVADVRCYLHHLVLLGILPVFTALFSLLAVCLPAVILLTPRHRDEELGSSWWLNPAVMTDDLWHRIFGLKNEGGYIIALPVQCLLQEPHEQHFRAVCGLAR